MDMHRAGRVALSIVTGFVVATVLASACVVAFSQYQRAERAEDHVSRLDHDLDNTNLDLQMTRADLSQTEAALQDVQTKLAETDRTLTITIKQRDTLDTQTGVCRYLIRINDHLLFGMAAQSDATGHLLRAQQAVRPAGKSRQRQAARRDIRRAGAHARAIQTLVKQANFKSISALVNACAPPSQK